MWFIKWYAPEKVKPPQHPLKNILYFETCFRVQTLKFINCYWNYKPLLYTQKISSLDWTCNPLIINTKLDKL